MGEIIAGVLLGPTAFGRIPGFTQNVFPQNSIALLTNVADIGLSLFLFLIGLETSLDLMRRQLKNCISITLPGMIIPFGVATGISHLMYTIETDQSVKFTTFVVFQGTVMAVTSLSVLSRVLAEIKLIQFSIGSLTLACGVMNDLIGYLLLAVGSSLVGGKNSLLPLYELLTVLAYVIFLFAIWRPLMVRYIDAKAAKPSLMTMTVVIVTALVSAWFTDICGVHPILGAFVAGVAVPHDNGFAVKVTERIEDLVIGIFLPIYFALSGFKTDLTLLNDGKTWGLIVLMIFGIFITKTAATTFSAKLVGMPWRESLSIGILMNSKAVIELIILNVGLELGVINTKIFAMMVIVFVVSTLTAVPLATAMYPPSIREERQAVLRDMERKRDGAEDLKEKDAVIDVNGENLLMPLIQASTLPSLLQIMALLASTDKNGQGPSIHALRLLPQSYRMSTAMRLSEVNPDKQNFIFEDPLLNTLGAFAVLRGGSNVVPHLEYSEEEDFVDTVEALARAKGIKKVLYGWDGLVRFETHDVQQRRRQPSAGGQGTLHSRKQSADAQETLNSATTNSGPMHHLEAMFRPRGSASPFGTPTIEDKGKESEDYFSRTPAPMEWQAKTPFGGLFSPSLPEKKLLHGSSAHQAQVTAHFVSDLLRRAKNFDVAIYVDQQASDRPMRKTARRRNIVVPFFSGPDDRAAVDWLRMFCEANDDVEGWVVALGKDESGPDEARTAPATPSGLSPRSMERTLDKQGEESLVDGFAHQETIHASGHTMISNQHEDSAALARVFQRPPMEGTSSAPVLGSSALRSPPGLFRTVFGKGENLDNSHMSSKNLSNLHMVTTSSTNKYNAVQSFLAALNGKEGPQLQRGDMIACGRGKIGGSGRGPEFRSEVNKMSASLYQRNVSKSEITALGDVGKVLGSVAEGILVARAAGIPTSQLEGVDLIVVQASHGRL